MKLRKAIRQWYSILKDPESAFSRLPKSSFDKDLNGYLKILLLDAILAGLFMLGLNLMRGVFYDVIGGAKHYTKYPPVVKEICRGLKRTLILRRFRTAGQLREHLENIEWD